MPKQNFWKNKKILVTGGRGFVGSHVVDNLIKSRKVDPSQIFIPQSKKDDLRVFENARRIMKGIDVVLHLAADVGGIAYSSSHPATQLINCLLIDANMFEAASQAKVSKFVCVSSAVAYPVNVSSPLNEKDLFYGLPAKGGYGYGFAKRTSVVMAQAYKEEKGLDSCVLLSTNMFGPRDSFDLESGHVIPSLIRKCLTEKELTVWGDGSQVRDFLYVKDFAEAVLLAAEKLTTYDPVNIGSGKGVSIKELVTKVVRVTKFKGKVTFDASKPTGQKERVLDVKKAKMLIGFSPAYLLANGLKETMEWYKEQKTK